MNRIVFCHRIDPYICGNSVKKSVISKIPATEKKSGEADRHSQYPVLFSGNEYDSCQSYGCSEYHKDRKDYELHPMSDDRQNSRPDCRYKPIGRILKTWRPFLFPQGQIYPVSPRIIRNLCYNKDIAYFTIFCCQIMTI